jgi:hypothetical protein
MSQFTTKWIERKLMICRAFHRLTRAVGEAAKVLAEETGAVA